MYDVYLEKVLSEEHIENVHYGQVFWNRIRGIDGNMIWKMCAMNCTKNTEFVYFEKRNQRIFSRNGTCSGRTRNAIEYFFLVHALEVPDKPPSLF